MEDRLDRSPKHDRRILGLHDGVEQLRRDLVPQALRDMVQIHAKNLLCAAHRAVSFSGPVVLMIAFSGGCVKKKRGSLRRTGRIFRD